MKRKITSLICGLALMLTMFCVPTGAAEQLVGYDYGTITVGSNSYNFTLGVVTASAATTGETQGFSQMNCRMYIDTASGTYWNSGSDHLTLEVILNGRGNIHYSESGCTVNGASDSVLLSVG